MDVFSLNALTYSDAPLGRAMDSRPDTSPLGPGSRLRHVVGRDDSGGFEWIAAPSTGVLSGIRQLRRSPAAYSG